MMKAVFAIILLSMPPLLMMMMMMTMTDDWVNLSIAMVCASCHCMGESIIQWMVLNNKSVIR